MQNYLLFLIDEPLVLNLECPTLIIEGHDVTLHCYATGNPPPNINWVNSNSPLIQNNLSLPWLKLTLIIQTLTETDFLPSPFVNYWNREKTNRMQNIFLFLIDEPLVLNLECPTSIIEGYNATLHCNATGNPPPNINWIRKETGDVLGTNEQLTLTAVNRSKAGTFQCLAWNGIGKNSTRTCSPDVYCKPFIFITKEHSLKVYFLFENKPKGYWGIYFIEAKTQLTATHRSGDAKWWKFTKPRSSEVNIHRWPPTLSWTIV